jgi:hypothetical protein
MRPDDIAFLMPRSLYPGDRVNRQWVERHLSALEHPTPQEAAIIEMARGIDSYISVWYGVSGRDYVLGESLAQMIEGWRGLLNGDLGRLDAGTLDAWACRAASRIGWDLDSGTWAAPEVEWEQ